MRSDRARLLIELAGRIAARRRPTLGQDFIEWTVGHPILCPYRLTFRAWFEGGLSLVIFDADGRRILPPNEGQSMGFIEEQHDQLVEILFASRGRPWWEVGE